MRRSSFIPLEMKELGKYLRRLRGELGLSIRNVARRTKLSPSYISKLEAGDTFQTINVNVLIRFSEIYGISITALLTESGFLHSDEDALPPLAGYLRKKYRLSPQAIRDMEMAKDIVDKKYSSVESLTLLRPRPQPHY